MAVKKHRPTSPRILQSRAEQVQNKDRQNKSKRIPQRIPCQWLVTQTQQKAQNWWQLVCLNNENDQWRASLSPSVPLSPVLSLTLSLCVSLRPSFSYDSQLFRLLTLFVLFIRWCGGWLLSKTYLCEANDCFTLMPPLRRNGWTLDGVTHLSMQTLPTA